MGYTSVDSGAPVDGIILDRGSGDRRTIDFRFRQCVDTERLLGARERR